MRLINKHFLAQMPFWVVCILVFVVGSSMPLAFAPFEWRWVAPFSVFIFFLLLKENPKQAFWQGIVFGAGMFGFGISWVFNSLHDYGSASVFAAGAITFLLVAIMALYLGLMCLIARRWFHVSTASTWLLVFPSLWLLTEYLRGTLFSGFPWLLLGYTQVDTFLSAYIPVIGVFGVSALIAVVSGAGVVLVRGLVREKIIAVSIITSIVLGAVIFSKQEWTRPVGEPIKVALVQGNIPQIVKFDPNYLNDSLDIYLELSRQHYDSDIILWPETAVPAFRFQMQQFLSDLEAELIENDTELLTGIFEYDFKEDRYYNSMITVGGEEGIYHKRHLVPFGEYMPLRWLLTFLGQFVQIPMSDISAGENDGRVLTLAGVTVGVSICYESAYSNLTRIQLPKAQILANASNDAWFGESLAPFQHLEIARGRALESGRYFLRVTNTGISAIINPEGKIVERAQQFKKEVIFSVITAYQGMTPYIRFGIMPLLLLAAIIITVVQVVFRRRLIHG